MFKFRLLPLYWRSGSKTFWRGSPTCAPGWSQYFPSPPGLQSLRISFFYVTLCTAFPSPQEKNHPERGRFPYFFLSRGDACTQAIWYRYLCCHDTFQLQVTQRSTRKGPHWKRYNVGKQKQNCSHSFVFGEVILSLFSWKCTCINLLWVYIDFFLSSLEGVQTPVGDLHNPMTVNHTPRWRQVSMEPDSSVVKVLHSLEWKRNISVINLKHVHRLKSGIYPDTAF